MKHLAHVLFPLFLRLGGPGLLVLGILDSSFLFAPLGNDLLVVALSARHHSLALALYYAAMSTIGSVLGCLLVDVVFRKAGEKGLERHLAKKRLEYVKKKIEGSGTLALAIASIAPPPFPFHALHHGCCRAAISAETPADRHRNCPHGALHLICRTGADLRTPDSAVGAERRGTGRPHRADDSLYRGQRDFGGGLD